MFHGKAPLCVITNVYDGPVRPLSSGVNSSKVGSGDASSNANC